MRVPVFVGDGRIDWTEKPVPEPGPGELLLQVGANALCGTDRLQHRFGSPVTPGHEAAGTVVAVGPGPGSGMVGQRGVAYLMGYCNACRSCSLGHTNQCLDKHADLGFERDGGYGPYAVIHERCFFPIPDDVSLTDATLLLDVMGTSGHAIGRARLVRDDIETVVIAGAGPIGLGLVAMTRLVLGEGVRIAISDPDTERLVLAEELGASPVRNGKLWTSDVAFDASGRSEARRELLDALAKRGVLVCVGHGRGLELKVSPDLIATERAVMGSEYFRFGELSANLEYLRANRDYLRQIITHRLPAAELEAAFAAFLGAGTGKVVIEHAT